jgi:hypothetical protein
LERFSLGPGTSFPLFGVHEAHDSPVVLSTSSSASGKFFGLLGFYPVLTAPMQSRFPGITVGSNVAQVLAYPAAKLLEFLPTTQYTTFGQTWSFNPFVQPSDTHRSVI